MLLESQTFIYVIDRIVNLKTINVENDNLLGFYTTKLNLFYFFCHSEVYELRFHTAAFTLRESCLSLFIELAAF